MEKDRQLEEAENDLQNAWAINTERRFKGIDSQRLRRKLKFVAIDVFTRDVEGRKYELRKNTGENT